MESDQFMQLLNMIIILVVLKFCNTVNKELNREEKFLIGTND